MSKYLRFLIIIMFLILPLSSFAVNPVYQDVIYNYYFACQSKDLDTIKEIIDDSNKNTYNKIIKMHNLLFQSLNLSYKNIKIIDVKETNKMAIVIVSLDAKISSLETNDFFLRKDKYVFFIQRNSPNKIIKIINYANYILMKKNYIYMNLLEKLLQQ